MLHARAVIPAMFVLVTHPTPEWGGGLVGFQAEILFVRGLFGAAYDLSVICAALAVDIRG